jgi:hypothetical protein
MLLFIFLVFFVVLPILAILAKLVLVDRPAQLRAKRLKKKAKEEEQKLL